MYNNRITDISAIVNFNKLNRLSFGKNNIDDFKFYDEPFFYINLTERRGCRS